MQAPPQPGHLQHPDADHHMLTQCKSPLRSPLGLKHSQKPLQMGILGTTGSPQVAHQSYPRVPPCHCVSGECLGSTGPTVLSSRYFCHMSTVSPELALQGTSGDTMLWLTSAERWVRTVERCLQ